MSIYSDSKLKHQVPISERKLGRKINRIKGRDIQIFSWRYHPARVYEAALQNIMRKFNHNFDSHADYGGQKEGSAVDLCLKDMIKHFPDWYKELAKCINPLDLKTDEKVYEIAKNRLYNRAYKTAQGKDKGASTNCEHWTTWGKAGRKGKPVTTQERVLIDEIFIRVTAHKTN